jgi:mannose/cellobiose epimerase-like protein (N-acyl-D-glucosamine 2-epimerase family)
MYKLWALSLYLQARLFFGFLRVCVPLFSPTASLTSFRPRSYIWLLLGLAVVLLLAAYVGSGSSSAQDAPASRNAPSTQAPVPADSGLTGASLWRTQGLQAILPAWTRHARDTVQGGFHSALSRSWRPLDGASRRYPGMLARHVFSYSAAYLLSGEARHLDVAEALVDRLIRHGWDETHGGWYNAVQADGTVVDPAKDLFMQIYAATGLTLYYTATRSDRARRYVERTHQLLEGHAWDADRGGYVRALNRDLSVRTRVKDFTPQGAALSGYLLYLYQATRDTTYRTKATRILDRMRGAMRAPGPPWIYERFNPDWSFRPDDRKNASINIGHNVELAWLLLRMHAMTGRSAYRQDALRLADRLHARAFVPSTGTPSSGLSSGAWVHRLARPALRDYPDTTPWWVQAYGNMFELALHHATDQPEALDRFRQGARFWNAAFVDSTHGGTVLKAALDGQVADGRKAVRTKTSYHAMEHALLCTLYLGLTVEERPVTLHFRVVDSEAGETLYPLPLALPGATIQQAAVNGTPWTDVNADEPAVRLPARDTARVRVTLAP